VKKTNRLVVVDENWPMASISSEVAYRVQKDAFDFLGCTRAARVPGRYAAALHPRSSTLPTQRGARGAR
jgi:pyruvate dehydrogenase E1 component beta subunit